MAEDVGGSPYSDGADHGGADDEFATVVFDEAFVRCAAVHEPSARERQLAAAEARLEPDTVPGWSLEPAGPDGYDGLPLELRPHPSGLDDDRIYTDPWVGPARPAGRRRATRWPGYGTRGALGRRQIAQQRWHRPVAWVLVILMGASLVAVAVAAVYRGAGASAPGHAPGVGGTTSSSVPVQPHVSVGSAAAVPQPTG
ncbi:hypothetical protein P3T36_003534 [Kitasatospora sp. MAP12-15]|uniref:SCO2584 family spore wall biosynthesis protein n=1 Tax=unclassified Kitasatospora TaxID=2633591 RepID=UPI002474CB0A|nr:hypothetical protein [Kitasatospora sp. MAP12-44]MDH6110496.1 hypothetical protein [Kitasatospora sp. MAP12-44]